MAAAKAHERKVGLRNSFTMPKDNSGLTGLVLRIVKYENCKAKYAYR